MIPQRKLMAINRKFTEERQSTQRFWRVKQVFSAFAKLFSRSLSLFSFKCRKGMCNVFENRVFRMI